MQEFEVNKFLTLMFEKNYDEKFQTNIYIRGRLFRHENEYDTCLLKSNLAFPLLHELSRAGDLLAKRAFKEEIAKRFENGFLPVVYFLLYEGYLDDLSDDYIKDLVESKPDFCSNIIFDAMDSDMDEGYLLSLYLFDLFYPYLSKNVVQKFVDIIKKDKDSVGFILYEPRMLTPTTRTYVISSKIHNVKLAVVLDMLAKQSKIIVILVLANFS